MRYGTSPKPVRSAGRTVIGPRLDEPIHESGPRLAALLAEELAGDGPLYRQVADALKRLVDRGEVPLGTILPAERALARALAMSRSTVVAAYERLKAEGWLESRRGSGTWVRRPDERRPQVDAVATGRLFLSADGQVQRFEPGRGDLLPDTVDLSVAALPASPTVRAVLSRSAPAGFDALLDHHGYLPHGLPELRAAVAGRYIERGLSTDPDDVVITTGAHQALSLIARQTIRPGDAVIVETPTFPGLLDVFRRFGARAVPMPVDERGARTELLDDLVARTGARLVYLGPDHHNPTGTVLPLERRRIVAEVAERRDVVVIEDQAMGEVDLDDAPLPPPISALGSGQVLTVGSTSKLYWAGLRVGWVRHPHGWAVRMLATKTVADLGSPLLDQLHAAELLRRRDEVLAERRRELLPRRDRLAAGLREALPDWTFAVPRGGLSLWVQLPHGNAEEFAERALDHGVAVVPGPALSVDEGNRRALRLSFVAPEPELDRAVERLAAAWAAYEPTGPLPSARLVV
jgi:DNA-binding transcriptional MocR family regulator